jgi:hypothetical protein
LEELVNFEDEDDIKEGLAAKAEKHWKEVSILYRQFLSVRESSMPVGQGPVGTLNFFFFGVNSAAAKRPGDRGH